MKKYIVIKQEKTKLYENIDILLCNQKSAQMYKKQGFQVIEIKENKQYNICISSEYLAIQKGVIDAWD